VGWWTDKAFSKPAPSKKEADKAYRKALRQNKCPVCHKRWNECQHTAVSYKYKPVKEKKVITDKNDHKRTVTVNAGYTVDDRGINWCSKCSCRVMNGRCTNVTCSSRR
jgi:hypothetical protein